MSSAAAAVSSRWTPSCSRRPWRRWRISIDTGRARRLAPERIDGEPIAGTEAERLLLAHGFLKGHRRLVLRA